MIGSNVLISALTGDGSYSITPHVDKLATELEGLENYENNPYEEPL